MIDHWRKGATPAVMTGNQVQDEIAVVGMGKCVASAFDHCQREEFMAIAAGIPCTLARQAALGYVAGRQRGLRKRLRQQGSTDFAAADKPPLKTGVRFPDVM
jgi:hypothetical protein